MADPDESRAPSMQEAALLNWAKDTIGKSTETAAAFHQNMLTASATFGTLITTAVPLLIWGDAAAKISPGDRWILMLPLILMLISAVVFALGYYPRTKKVQMNDLEAAEKARAAIITFRAWTAAVGLALFIASLITTVWFVVEFVRPAAA